MPAEAMAGLGDECFPLKAEPAAQNFVPEERHPSVAIGLSTSRQGFVDRRPKAMRNGEEENLSNACPAALEFLDCSQLRGETDFYCISGINLFFRY